MPALGGIIPKVTVTVVRPGGRDRYGDEKPATEHELHDCLVWPRSSTESTDYADSVFTGKEIWSDDPDADVVATDRIRLPGEAATHADGTPAALWRVEGDPGNWGVGVQIAITKATG